MTDTTRLIERAFPLKQASMDSVHEKSVRHGHISTLHIWPARRPLAACRAALIATLLPDPGSPEKRKVLSEKFAGTIVEKRKRKKDKNGQIVERMVEETEGGILHWNRETENKETLDWFRSEIRKAYGGRAPRVLDPFSGGGAIPLEAMRLGCEVTACDINPVAWFVLKCTLEYPQKLAGQKRPLPAFILQNKDFMASFYEAQGLSKKDAAAKAKVPTVGSHDQPFFQSLEHDVSHDADLAWHVRAWGQWVLDQARKELAPFYPTYADFEPLTKGVKSYETQPMRLVPLKDDGLLDIAALNQGSSTDYLRDKTNPRWVAKPTVAYLWARTVQCKNCRAMIPLLKTRWLCKKEGKRILLHVAPNPARTGVTFAIETDVPVQGATPKQRGEHDKKWGAATMSRSGAKCVCCPSYMEPEDLRMESQQGRVGAILHSVVVDGPNGKEYRLPTPEEASGGSISDDQLGQAFARLPFGPITEALPQGGSRAGGGSPFTVHLYGLRTWADLFNRRQLLSAATLVQMIRKMRSDRASADYDAVWRDALSAYLTAVADKVADYNSTLCTWHNSGEKMGHTFARFALPITWDYAELAATNDVGGSFLAQLEWVSLFIEHGLAALSPVSPRVTLRSALESQEEQFDAIVTDPPYYDAIPYSDLMDFFHVWLRRSLHDLSADYAAAFSLVQGPKWNHEARDGELIDDAHRFGDDAQKSKTNYEDGMCRAFEACHRKLTADGRLVVVFANKQPDAWETLASALIRAGFLVDGSWPIQTEMGTRTRARSSAALSSSVWLVCRKRPASRPGWDNAVLQDMHANIANQLVEFWDAGIRGPDFVWAALGPALEAYSKYPVVKKAKSDTGEPMSVSEFLSHVRRLVIDFVVGRVLSGGGQADMAMADKLDGVTAYYLLHRNDFKLDPAPAGACILYALSCGVSDHDLAQVWNLVSSSGNSSSTDEQPEGDDEEGGEEAASATGSEVRLLTWKQRKGKSLGLEAPGGRDVPLIDRIHRLLHLWAEGDQQKVDAYLDENALRRSELFRRVLQAIIELADKDSEERKLLEALSNHIQGKGAVDDRQQRLFDGERAVT